MGSKAQADKSRDAAKYMKEMGIRRKTSACPMGCGAQIPNGGQALISHLARCSGKKH